MRTEAFTPPAHTAERHPFASDPFFQLTQQINELIASRAYQLFESQGFVHGHDREDWLRAESEILLDVPVDITETDTELILRADVPGFGEKDLEVRAAPRYLCLTGKRPEVPVGKEGKTIYSERRSKQIFRLLELPAEVDPTRVHAALSEGILELKLTKAKLAQKVPVLAKEATA